MKYRAYYEYKNRLVFVYSLFFIPHLILFCLAYLPLVKEGASVGEISDTESLLFFFVTPITLLFPFVLQWIFKRQMRPFLGTSFRSRLEAFMKFSQLRFAFFCLYGLLLVACFYFTQYRLFAGAYVYVLIAVSIANPTLYSVARAIKANKDELHVLKTDGDIPLESRPS